MSNRTRSIVVGFALVLAVLSTSQPARAQAFVGQFCWQLAPFSDTLRIGFTQYPSGVFANDVRWRGTGYQFQGSGVFSADSSNPGQFLLAFSSAGTTVNFACDFQGHMDAAGGGTWEFHCPKTGFTNSGTLTFLAACPAAAVTDEPVAPTGPTGPTSQDR